MKNIHYLTTKKPLFLTYIKGCLYTPLVSTNIHTSVHKHPYKYPQTSIQISTNIHTSSHKQTLLLRRLQKTPFFVVFESRCIVVKALKSFTVFNGVCSHDYTIYWLLTVHCLFKTKFLIA